MAVPSHRIMYVELKSELGDRGPAWIGRVKLSKSGQTFFFRANPPQPMRAGGIAGNFVNVETREEYWVSGPKRDGSDRHWAGGGPVAIDADVADHYWAEIRGAVPPTNPLIA